MSGEDSEPAVKVTLTTIYDEQQDMKRLIAERLPADLHDRLRKAEIQLGAQWVVVGLVVVGLGGLLTRTFIGG